MRAMREVFKRPQAEGTPPNPRQGLRDAKLEATRARQALAVAQGVTARAREVIADADDAEQAALDAEKAYTDSIAAWARAACSAMSLAILGCTRSPRQRAPQPITRGSWLKVSPTR